MTKEAGKGDTYRSVVWDKYSNNYDTIFGKTKHRVSGVPYEVELKNKDDEIIKLVEEIDAMVMDLERENFMLRARCDRLEDEARSANELANRLNIELINERNRNASGNH